MTTYNISEIAALLTDDPNIFCEAEPVATSDEGPQVRNVGTTGYRGTVASTNNRYQKALSGQQADPKKYIKEVQKIIVMGAKELAADPKLLTKYLKLLKMTVNADLLKIAQYYRTQLDQKEQQDPLQDQQDQLQPPQQQGTQLGQPQ